MSRRVLDRLEPAGRVIEVSITLSLGNFLVIREVRTHTLIRLENLEVLHGPKDILDFSPAFVLVALLNVLLQIAVSTRTILLR